MRKAFVLISLCFCCISLYSQDVLIKKSGDELKVKILEIGMTEIKYKAFESPDGATYVVLKSDVFMIRYENGTKDVFKDETPKTIDVPATPPEPTYVMPQSQAPPVDLFAKGESDANKYYTKYTGAGTGSFFSGFCLGPVCGLIVPAATAGSEPKTENLGYPDSKLFSDPSYRAGYTSRAFKIKRKKAWNNYLIGAVVSTAANLIYIVSVNSSR